MRTLLLFLSFTVTTAGLARADEQAATKLDTTVKVQLKYLISTPKGYAEKDKWPLLLFLHGAGERGDNLDLVKVHGPPKLIAAGKEFPFIVVSPQCPKDRNWESLELIALIDEVSKTHKVDPDRIYVTGLSMGGFGTWRLAATYPERIAAIAPVCGGGEAFWARSFAHIPCWAFHGAKDGAVPLDRSQTIVDALKNSGGSPKLTIYPEAGHDSWTETYNNPELYTWLLEQKRQPKTP